MQLITISNLFLFCTTIIDNYSGNIPVTYITGYSKCGLKETISNSIEISQLTDVLPPSWGDI